jgi:hypothetical protein
LAEEKPAHFPTTAYDLSMLCSIVSQIGPATDAPVTELEAVAGISFQDTGTARRKTMAKGQLRGNREAKKPKKAKQPVVPPGSFITPPKTTKPPTSKH